VRALRKRGWNVQTVSLYPPEAGAEIGADLAAGRIVLYRSQLFSTLLNAGMEFISHPLQSVKTKFTALHDAMFPLEPLNLRQRFKLILQSFISLGLARKLRARGVRHIHCHFANSAASVGMYAAMQLEIPFSFTGHANDLFQHRVLLKRKLERAAFVSCISRWHRDWYLAISPPNPEKYEVIRCGVDVDAWQPGERGQSTADPLRILVICRLVEKKGVDTLIRAVNILRTAGVACRLTVAGDGPQEIHLHVLAKILGCDDSIRWLGAVDNNQVPQLMSQADVFALPCRSDSRGDKDGIPVVLMEAMACGVPVISGDLPAIRELIEDGVSGILIPGGDADALAQRLKIISTDSALRQKLALAGRSKVVSEFALEPNIDHLEARFSLAIEGMKCSPVNAIA
jgi:glycosyltransferase involved in cell wall biosynthesis